MSSSLVGHFRGPVITELPELRDRERVFRDRRHAGQVLARMLEGKLPAAARLLAIPAGGAPVAAAIAEALELPLEVAVTSKITPSWNSEVGAAVRSPEPAAPTVRRPRRRRTRRRARRRGAGRRSEPPRAA